MGHPPEAAGGCPKANDREVVTDNPDRARTGREKGGEQKSKPLATSVGFAEHGVVAEGKRQDQ